MKIAVIGAGAMGGLWASQLTASGHEVTVVDVSESVVERIRAEGLEVEGPGGERTTSHPRATTHSESIGVVDVVFFFVKAAHTDSAARVAVSLVAESTIVATLQNGWGNADVLAGHFRPAQIVMGVTYNSATVRAPGQIAHTGSGPSFIGSYEKSGPPPNELAELQDSADLPTTIAGDIRQEVWKKLILNAVTLPTSALTGLTAGALGSSAVMSDLLKALCDESVAVANAMGLGIDPSERLSTIHAVLERAGAGKASMLQDVEARRKTEIEVINEAVVKEAARYDLAVPLNSAMTSLVKALEGGYL
ncbi:MAG: 2-dehydropantoate 2-reductase [Dehalococcoidia bacterium]